MQWRLYGGPEGQWPRRFLAGTQLGPQFGWSQNCPLKKLTLPFLWRHPQKHNQDLPNFFLIQYTRLITCIFEGFEQLCYDLPNLAKSRDLKVFYALSDL